MAPDQAFVWGPGGAQMTPDRIAAERKVAQAMMAQGMDFSPVQSPWQGAARVAQAMMGGYDSYRADQAEKANLTANQEMITKLLNGGGDTTTQVAAPSAAASSPAAFSDNKVYGNDELSPLDNLDLKEKIKKFEGFTPTAVWDYKQNSNGYGTKAAYAGEHIDPATAEARLSDEVAKARAITDRVNPNMPTGASDALTSLTFNAGDKWKNAGLGQAVQAGDMGAARSKLLQYNQAGGDVLPGLVSRRQQEAGWIPDANAAVRVASLGGATSPDSVPAPAQPAAPAPVQVAQAGGGGLSGVNPALIQAITSPYASEGTKKIATLLLQQKLQGDAVTTVDLGNAVGIMDKRGNIVRQVPKGEPNKGPTYGVINEDEYGKKTYGWINPRDMTTRADATAAPQPAVPVAGNGQPAIPPPPPGVNPKVWRDEQTRIAADAAGGKLTDAQVNATQFANRMEDAEANLATVEPEITAGGFGPFKDRLARGMTEGQYNPVPRGATNWAVSNSYQKFEQAKSQYITALLRKESGAAISQSEFDRYDKEFFPQMGDSADVIKQKQQARKVAVDAMKKGAGPSYKSPSTTAASPTGVDPKVWAAMTPEEKSLWK